MDGEHSISNVTGPEAPVSYPLEEVYDLSRLTPGERLWLWRLSERTKARSRRGMSINSTATDTHPAPRSQLEAAVLLGLDASAYWAAEKDLLDPSVALRALARVCEPPYTLARALKVARRRSSMKVGEAAVGAGVGSKPTFYKIENAGDWKIVEFWRSRGFRFPSKLLQACGRAESVVCQG